MTDDIMKDIMDELGPPPPWKPGYFYSDAGDCLHVHWKQVQAGECGEWINNSITLYRDFETNEVIGVMVKNVKAAMEGKDPNDFHRGD